MTSRRRSVGAELFAGGVSFRVWAPEHERVAVVIDGREYPLAREDGGYFCGVVANAKVGTRYRLRVDDERETYPDPASRFQPDGPDGDSVVVDPSAYEWRDAEWRGLQRKGLVLYELHIGTFTREGSYSAAAQRLGALAEIGINAIELMPVNEFAGTFGWGYDGVDLWAPTRLYGTPDELRRFVDEAHAHGIGVLLDVVYNHLGPDGCYLTKFAKEYFTDRYDNEWGDAVNFESEARTFFIENAAYWIDEFHFDGLRIDATQSMFDASETHVVREICDAARAAAGGRSVVIVGENEPQQRRLLTRDGVDALWNDDWHHAAHVALTGRAEAYYSDYRGTAREFAAMARLGFLYQGQRYRWQKKRRGTPSRDIAPERLVCYLENHDQVANSARGERLQRLTSPARFRAMTALLLLQPQTPLLFQGQERGSERPFLYFADHSGELAEKVRSGRRDFLKQFPSIDGATLTSPDDRATFESCKLDDHGDPRVVQLHRDLLRLRREEPFVQQRSDWLEASTLSDDCLLLRWFTDDDRLLIVNLGRDLVLDPVPEPLLAPPAGARDWTTLWSSEHPDYGGAGMQEVETESGWHITGESAVVLRARM
ncbi:MAG TPA: malto-oligosyltrehalose trehalohydrolase [Thermoanaerobaculia bacterium]|jgi:maltooligosyltrehalose trehalohydrolase